VVSYYNDVIAREGNRQLEGYRGLFHHVRHRYGGSVVALSMIGVGALSSSHGRFAVLRNAALAGLIVGWMTFPATVTGLMVASMESIQATPTLGPAWTRKGELVVRRRREEPLTGTFSPAGDGHRRGEEGREREEERREREEERPRLN